MLNLFQPFVLSKKQLIFHKNIFYYILQERYKDICSIDETWWQSYSTKLLIFLTPVLICLVDVLAYSITLATSRYALDPLLFTAAPARTTVSLTVAADEFQNIVWGNGVCGRDWCIAFSSQFPPVVEDIQ